MKDLQDKIIELMDLFDDDNTPGMADGGRIGLSKGISPKVQEMLNLITPVRQKYIDLKQAQINDPKGGTLKNFLNYEQFLIKEINSVKNTKDAKKLISTTRYYLNQPEKLSISRKKLLDKLIDIENNKPGRSRPGHELAVQAGYKLKKGLDTNAPSGSFKNLINIKQKKLNRIDSVIQQIDNGQISLDDIIKEGSLTRYINKPFNYENPESFNILIRKNKKYKDRLDEFKLLNNQSFLNKYKGRGLLANEAQTVFEQGRTGGVNFSRSTQRGPIEKIFDFANRHIERDGKLIRKIDDNTFIYNNKIFSRSPNDVDQRALKKLGLQDKKIIDLVLEGPKQPEFKEIFNAFDKLREYETIERTHPVTGKKMPLTKLLQEADYIAGGKDRLSAKNIFGRNPFEIDHFGSVKDDPFKNIRVIPRTINQAAGQFQRGVSTFKDIKQAENFIGYNFTGDPLDSINQYINTEIQRGQNPNYQGRSKRIAAAKTKAIDTAAAELGQIGTRGGTILTQEIPPGVFSDRSVIGLDKRLKEAFTGVPVLEKTPGGKLTIGSRPVTEKEIISVPERDAMAKRLKDRLLNLDLKTIGKIPVIGKKISTPLEVGQQIIRGVTKKDGGRIPYRYGKSVQSNKRGKNGRVKKIEEDTFARRNPITTGAGLSAAGMAAVLKATGTPIRTALGKAFRGAGTRLGVLPFAGMQVKSNIDQGENIADAVVDPLVGLELFLPGVFKENLSKITTNPTAQRILNLAVPLGRAARLTTPVGLGITAAGAGIDLAKFTRDRINKLRAMSPEERAELRRQGDEFAFSEFSAAGGGIAKQAGDSSGRPPESGPNSQGLQGLIKRVRNL
jgi:hypothetical protein